MLPRIWIVLLAVLVLAAPAGNRFAESLDAQTSATFFDDAITDVQVQPAESSPDCTVCAVMLADAVPPAPALARIFRPPEPSFD